MARYHYFAITGVKPGRDDEFNTWYDTKHLDDVRAVPGVGAARRFTISKVTAEGIEAPPWRSLAIYEIETEGDPNDVIQAIVARAGTELMPISDALDREGMVQLLATEVASGPR